MARRSENEFSDNPTAAPRDAEAGGACPVLGEEPSPPNPLSPEERGNRSKILAPLSPWYSGDIHVHFLDPHTALLELEGEDLHVVNVLATRWRQVFTGIEHFTGAPSVLSRPGRIVRWAREEARFLDEGQRAELLDLFESARRVYLERTAPP